MYLLHKTTVISDIPLVQSHFLSHLVLVQVDTPSHSSTKEKTVILRIYGTMCDISYCQSKDIQDAERTEE